MNKAALLISLTLGLQLGVSGPALATQRNHRPWFSKKASFPAATGGESMDPRPVTAENDVKNSAKRNDSQGEEITKQALHYKGTRYRFGGTTKRGLDCSGLVSRVWGDLKM